MKTLAISLPNLKFIENSKLLEQAEKLELELRIKHSFLLSLSDLDQPILGWVEEATKLDFKDLAYIYLEDRKLILKKTT